MIVFRSEVGPDIMMFDDIARRMMELMGKEFDDRGVVTVEQLPGAIARLQAVAKRDRIDHRHADIDEDDTGAPPVGLSQRITPLLELLEISLARGKPVTWGV